MMSKTEMRPIKDTIAFAEARAIIAETFRPLDRWERVPLLEANQRVVAAEVRSPRDVPPFARAAMDGFAVRAEDTFGASQLEPRSLRVLEKVYTGQVATARVSGGTSVEIATGAPMPEGADAVVMVEETEHATATEVRVFTPVYPGQNVGRQGADIVRDQVVLRAGDVLNPSRIGALAALGALDVKVFTRPTVAILSTGNEIVDPGTNLKPGQIYDINKFTLSTIIAEHGGTPVPYQTAEDTVEDLERAIDACLACDVLVFSGGSSVGERDLIVDVLGRRGQILFHGIAVKPGKPTDCVHPIGRQAGFRDARLSDVVPIERVHAARACIAADGPLAALSDEHSPAADRPTDCVDHGPPSVLYGPRRRWSGLSRIQGVRGYHVDVARRRLHRDPSQHRNRGEGRNGQREAVLIRTWRFRALRASARERIHFRPTPVPRNSHESSPPTRLETTRRPGPHPSGGLPSTIVREANRCRAASLRGC